MSDIETIHRAINAFLPCDRETLWKDIEFQREAWPEFPAERAKLDEAIDLLLARGWLTREGGELGWCPRIEENQQKELFA